MKFEDVLEKLDEIFELPSGTAAREVVPGVEGTGGRMKNSAFSLKSPDLKSDDWNVVQQGEGIVAVFRGSRDSKFKALVTRQVYRELDHEAVREAGVSLESDVEVLRAYMRERVVLRVVR